MVQVLADLAENWAGLNSLAARHPDPRLARVRRDGHCHEAVMWSVVVHWQARRGK